MTVAVDWNWFFSSLAQSSAAIVGIFGAFIITKILSNQAVFAEKTSRLRSMLSEARRLQDSAGNLAFPWYVRLTLGYEFERAEEMLEDDPSASAEALFDKLRFPPFVPRQEILRSLENRRERLRRAKEAERRRREEEMARRAKASPLGFAAMSIPDSLKIPKGLNHPHTQLQAERDAIDDLRVQIRHHMRSIADFLESAAGNPESSRAISATLLMVALLFLLGVIYPLSFMPVSTAWKPELEVTEFWQRLISLRGGLLTSVSVIFLGAVVMFWQMNRRLVYDTSAVDELRTFTTIGAYSKYYEVAEKNALDAQQRVKDSNAANSPAAS